MEHIPSYDMGRDAWRSTLEELRTDNQYEDYTEMNQFNDNYFQFVNTSEIEQEFKFDWNELELENGKKKIRFTDDDINHYTVTHRSGKDDSSLNNHQRGVENDQNVERNINRSGNNAGSNEYVPLAEEQQPDSPVSFETAAIERNLQFEFDNNYVNDIVLALRRLKEVRARLQNLVHNVDNAISIDESPNFDGLPDDVEINAVKSSLLSFLADGNN
ncbi:Hypothetical protein J6896_03859 [Nakaseomyces glabratus]|nr:hypothetical protein J7298_03863 [Nakaseomyces glabratus]KAH7596262.1 hypothetical protein J7295_03833 [Nakaseomyces glabratus]KAH7611829.1 hypothetical protein J7292_03842 [Nakaseomyces glabratus]